MSQGFETLGKQSVGAAQRDIRVIRLLTRFGVELGLRAFLQLRLGRGDDGLRIPGLQRLLYFRPRSGDLPPLQTTPEIIATSIV